MSEQDKQHEEREEALEENQENLETREHDQIEDDIVKIPKKDFAQIKKQLKSANQEAKQRREELERFKGYGLEPDEIEQLIELRDKGGDTKQEQDDSRVDRKELDKQRKSLEQKYQQRIDQYEAEKSEMQKRLETTLIESAARDAIRSEKGFPEFLLDKVTSSSRLVQNDRGGYDVQIVDENGETEFNDRGEYMTIQDHVKALKNHEVFGRAFEQEVKRGAGMQGQQGNRKPKSDVTKSQLQKDRSAKHKFIAENGVDAYNALPS